jgi:NAD(P)H-dependent FMN reductase
MSKKVIAFAGSNSSTSINHSLVTAVAGLMEDVEVEVIRLTDYPLPIYSEDIEKEQGFPESLERLMAKLKTADGLVISVNEHNSGWSAFFKNTMDWLSRLERKYLEGVPVFLLSTSPGGRGGLSSLEFAQSNLPRVGALVISAVAVPRFYDNFDRESGRISDEDIASRVAEGIDLFHQALGG